MIGSKRIRIVTCHVFSLLAVLTVSAGCSQPVLEDTEKARKQMTQDVKQEVLKELREDEFLKQQIARGIQDYIAKQQAAQAKAREEQLRQVSEKAKDVRPVSRDRDHIYGNPDAEISLIEYSDFECSFCKRFHATPKEVVDAYGGRVNWVYRHLPLGFHNPGAQKQAEASECANELGGNDAFWAFSDAIYERTKSNGKGFPLADLGPLAVEIGLDEKRFADCVENGNQAARVNEDIVEAGEIGIKGTPTTIVYHNLTGETKLKVGAASVAALKADIDSLLE